MIPLAKHTAHILDEARVPILDPISVQISTDEAWSPRFQGQLVIHADDLALLPDRVIVRLRAAYGADLSIASITEWAGGTIAHLTDRVGGSVGALTALHTRPWNPFETTLPVSVLTALYGGDVAAVTAAHGGTVAAITETLRQPGGAYLPQPAQHLEVVCRVRPISSNRRTAEHRVELASEEIALHDYRRTETAVYVSAHTSLRALVQYVLDQVDGTLAPGLDTPITAGAEWAPGQTAWDFLHAVTEAAGRQLWADETGTYQLTAQTVTVSPLALDHDVNLLEWDENTAPVEDAVIVKYTGDDPPTYDVYAPAGYTRPRLEERDTSLPGAGAAEQLALRAATRARTAQAEAVSMYQLRPLDRVTCRPDDTTTIDGTISSVSWAYPDSTMRAKLRDLTTL